MKKKEKIYQIFYQCYKIEARQLGHELWLFIHIINDDLLNLMPNNSLFIDVSIDQGGMTTQSKPTTYDNPIIKFNNR